MKAHIFPSNAHSKIFGEFWTPHNFGGVCHKEAVLPCPAVLPCSIYLTIENTILATMRPIRNLLLFSIVLSQLFLKGAAKEQTRSDNVAENENKEKGKSKNKLRGLNRKSGTGGNNHSGGGNGNRGGAQRSQNGNGRSGGNRWGHTYQDPYMTDPYYYG